ncbi:hypothetical protein FH972_024254 [Carpinus fangiana]|uniref:Kinesin motor domain-containing protein n=1 Tax=Carpinus fangiana TaxID=176857 RepID=A0A5N6KY87_9ROSI|nr:hypothetical protein FH972_024254 [Carpinus fangiana]
MAPSGGGNIKVVVRVRPFNTREKERNAQCIVSMKGTQTTIAPPTNENRPKNNKAALEGPKNFAYDKSYWSFDKNDADYAGQEALFKDLGLPLLDNAFAGYNNCIFAYGQTGSGKSYSMMGYGPEAGVIPKICKDMFDRIDKLQLDKTNTCTVEVSYLEIYNERVRDLLNPSNKGNLKVREHPSTGPYVEDLAKLLVRSFPEIENLMDEGNKARTVAATNMNETSSRSHAVFTLTLTQRKHDEDTKMDAERVAKISLVDLAGSERANSTGATGARLKEGAEINRSLSTLGRVIAALADVSSGKKKNMSMVPYRDSVLTWLLKDSLGGNSMTAMIAAISPADINFEETLSTLRYADSAKRIKNHAVVNEDANARMIRELKEELAQLRSKLSSGGNDMSGTPGSFNAGDPQYPPDTPLEKQMVTITAPDGSTKQVSKAEIAEQLSQSEKLYTDLNQTWEQKLQKTEEIHKEREAALEELGISIEKGFIGVSTPKKMPHLVNLSDDPLLAECLVYNLKPGDTTVGNDEMATTAEIRLKGSKILQEHCIFQNKDGVVSVIPHEDAAVMVNGLKIDKTRRLHSGYRVILGDFHIFRFNNPQEARAERAAEGSLLKQSLTVDDIDSPSEHRSSSHNRSLSTFSRLDSEADTERTGAGSPSPYMSNGQDYDWSFARREAAGAILGEDKQIASLTDEQLDALYEDLQRVRATRRAPLEGRLLGSEDDTDSTTSYPVREKYMSSATLDGFSIDTALTAPSTPPHGEDGDRLVSMDLASQLEKSGRGTPRSVDGSESQMQEMQAEKAAMELKMQSYQAEMEKQLEQQRLDYEKKLEMLRPNPSKPKPIDAEMDFRDKSLAKHALQKWRQRKYVRMAGHMLQYSSLLKEAQILSHQMGKTVNFQFAIVDAGQTLGSSYDLVLNGISDEDDDDLVTAPKPCIGVRVTDYKHLVVYLWSVSKLSKRVQLMRQMQQYLDRPEYVRHFRIDNPFSDSCLPQYSRIGEAQVSLSAVFESRVQDFVVDVISPYTFSVIGILKLSLEPSLAEAPESTLKFNVVLHDMAGFPEMEGSNVHAQLSLPRVSEEEGMTATQLIKSFNEGPIHFDSLHGMSLPATSSRDVYLKISIFAQVTSMHLDKLLSWDDMRDSAQRIEHNGARINESEYKLEEKHDVFARAQILELSEVGEYAPVDVVQVSNLDSGAYQLHQGLQRKIVVSITHTCGESLPWKEVTGFRAGHVRLLDSAGRMPELASSQPDVPLKLVGRPSITTNADGTTNVRLAGQWDSGSHNSLLLDRTTSEKHRVQFSLMWDVSSPRLTDPLHFSLDVCVQIRPRAFLRAPSVLSQLWGNTRVAHSTTGIFMLGLQPSPIESATDLWRMDTQYEYVKGEENLTGWYPRGVSLVRDHVEHRRRLNRAADIETTKSVFGNAALNVTSEPSSGVMTPEQQDTAEKFVAVWRSTVKDPSTTILKNVEPPKNGAPSTPSKSRNGSSEESRRKPPISASVTFHPKNPVLLKSGHLLMPDPTQTKWIRRFVELRHPFLHIYSVPDGDEVNAINLSGSRVDHQPAIAEMLHRPGGGLSGRGSLNVFAVYARDHAWLFATTSEREKVEWVLKLDESYFGSRSGTPANSHG